MNRRETEDFQAWRARIDDAVGVIAHGLTKLLETFECPECQGAGMVDKDPRPEGVLDGTEISVTCESCQGIGYTYQRATRRRTGQSTKKKAGGAGNKKLGRRGRGRKAGDETAS